ncbi:MAG: CCA tRNA nucleotidyltransferase [Acidaminococcales bacterium]|jgi:tRNA nucleotidyltransferase/poly(A) polymerase|nr:CCA tRNA nucleotidyltransferase [Acidaminococcales bacterium]
MNLPLPAHIKKILGILAGQGFAAYVVGGAVRDCLLGAQPQDYDIATNAAPQEIGIIARANGLKIIDKMVNRFGVTMLVIDKATVEISSFRREWYGADAHRPEKVVFCQTLEEDLARRDFTINAMAVGADGELSDPYGGRLDMAQKCLRTVGNADERFAEDALRMFRACRFCARLGFLPAPELMAGINRQRKRTHGLSLERVKSEIEKILAAAHPDIGLQMLAESGLADEHCSFRRRGERKLAAILPELQNAAVRETEKTDAGRDARLRPLTRVPAELSVRWAALFCAVTSAGREKAPENTPGDCGKIAAAMAEHALNRFLYGSKFIRRVSWLLRNYGNFALCLRAGDGQITDWLRTEAQSGYFRLNSDFTDAFSQLRELCAAFMSKHYESGQEAALFRQFSQRLAEKAKAMPVHTSELAIGPADMDGCMPSGMTGDFLNRLLRKTQTGELKNSRPELLQHLHSILPQSNFRIQRF